MEALRCLWHQIINTPWTQNDTMMTIIIMVLYLLFIGIMVIIDCWKKYQFKSNK